MKEMGGACSTYGERRGVYRVLEGRPEGKRPLGRLRHSEDDNIKRDVQEIGCVSVEWVDLSQDRDKWCALVKKLLNLRFSKILGVCLTS
jgi:hypothetical protein